VQIWVAKGDIDYITWADYIGARREAHMDLNTILGYIYVDEAVAAFQEYLETGDDMYLTVTMGCLDLAFHFAPEA
jgi:hypothetical protein